MLASRSPQRRAILERLGVPFTIRPTHVSELAQGDPEQVAVENALRKARAAWAQGWEGTGDRPGAGGQPSTEGQLSTEGQPEVVLGCDTLVTLAGEIYGKPPSADAARRTLRVLSGATHEVLTGVALIVAASGADRGGTGHGRDPREGAVAERVVVVRTAVTFRTLGDGLLSWYVGTGEWRDRAGGYAIQGAGAALVRRVEGDYENVVGLPVATLLDLCPELLGTEVVKEL